MMRTIIHKTGALGPSAVFSQELYQQILHLVLHIPIPPSLSDGKIDALLLSQVTFVQQSKFLVREKGESFSIVITNKPVYDVIDLHAPIRLFGVKKQQDSVSCYYLGTQIDHKLWPISNNERKVLFSVISNHMLFNDSETFIHWLTEQWPRLSTSYKSELNNVKIAGADNA